MATSAHIDSERVTEQSQPSEDELFDVLANSRRRHVIELLIEADEILDIGTLATRIAARENEIEIEAVTSDERKRVYTALQQSHLPKLDAAGLIEFDKQRGTTAPLPALSAAEPYLAGSQTAQPWYRYYLGLTATSAIVVIGVWIGLWPFGLLSPLSVTGVISMLFGATALAHRYDALQETSVW